MRALPPVRAPGFKQRPLGVPLTLILHRAHPLCSSNQSIAPEPHMSSSLAPKSKPAHPSPRRRHYLLSPHSSQAEVVSAAYLYRSVLGLLTTFHSRRDFSPTYLPTSQDYVDLLSRALQPPTPRMGACLSLQCSPQLIAHVAQPRKAECRTRKMMEGGLPQPRDTAFNLMPSSALVCRGVATNRRLGLPYSMTTRYTGSCSLR